MRKINRIIMILASVLLSLVLITSSVLSGTFAKYVTGTKSVSSNTGRVAKWGVTVTSGEHLETQYTLVENNSFKVHTLGSTDVIAPGTSGSLAWFRADGNPEVAFDVDFSGSIDIGRGFWSLEDVIDYARDQMFPALKGKTEAEKKEIVQAEIVQEIKNAIQTEIGSTEFDALTESALQQKINEKIDPEIIQDLGKAAYGALTVAERNDLIITEAEVKAQLGQAAFDKLTEEAKQAKIKTEAEVITELGQTAFNKLTANGKDEKRAAKLLQKTNTRIAEKERDVLLSNFVKEKKEILLYDQDGKAIEYFPIIIYCVEYDMLNNGQMVERGRTCLTRTTLVKDQQGNVVLDDNGNELKDTHKYFGQHSFDSVTDMISALNGNVSQWALSRVFDDPYIAPNQQIDKVYAVEWHWPYSNTSDYPGKGSGSQGTYQTKELDGQLGEAVLKAPDMFNITLNMSVVVEQIEIPEGGTTTPEGGTTTPEDEPTTPEDEPTTPEGGTTTPEDKPTTPEGGTTTPEGGTTTPEDEPTTPVTPSKPNYVDINWKSLYDAGLMRSQWLYDISYALDNYTSLFDVTATEKELTSKAKGVGDDRSYFSTKMYNITSSTRYEYTFEAKNNSAGGYAGVMFAYDVNGLYPYFAYGEFDNRSTAGEGNCIHISCRKAHHNHENYNWCVVTPDLTAVVKQTDDGYGQYKVIYEGYNVKFCYLNTSGEYVQLGSTITLPAGSKVCVGVYSCNGSKSANADRTVSLRNCVLTAKNDETIDYLAGQNISLVKTFKLKVATFDINKGAGGIPNIVAAIKESKAEIIGLQKVCGADQVKNIAQGVGYEHYRFFKAINLEGGGEYGVAVISKYPIENSDQINLTGSGTGEQRILARAGIRLHNELINFFVTHLSYYGESGANLAQQFTAVANKIANYKNVILTGNFNTDTWTDFNPIVNKGFLLVNKSGDMTATYRYEGRDRAFDNIVHSKIFTSSGRGAVNNGASDHYLLYATLTYKQQKP